MHYLTELSVENKRQYAPLACHTPIACCIPSACYAPFSTALPSPCYRPLRYAAQHGFELVVAQNLQHGRTARWDKVMLLRQLLRKYAPLSVPRPLSVLRPLSMPRLISVLRPLSIPHTL